MPSSSVGLRRLVCLGTEVRGGRAGGLKIAGKDRLDQRSENDLSATSLRKSHPQNENELEGVVEWEPVDGIDGALNDGQKGIHHPVRQPLSVICCLGAEQSFQGVVPRNKEACEIGEEGASDVEEDEEEVDSEKAEEGVDLGNGGLLLEIVEDRVLGELLIDLGDMILGFVLERHLEGYVGLLGECDFVKSDGLCCYLVE